MPDWINILIRAVLLFFLVVFLARVMGRKHPAKVTPFSFINYAVIAVITALIVVNPQINPAHGLIALAVWTLFPVAVDFLALRSKMVHDLVYGREAVLIKQGTVMEDNLRKLRLTGEELLKDLRSKNVFNVADVEFAVMETSGDINVLLKAEKKPLSAHDLEWKVGPQAEPQTVILDGEILDNSLTNMGLNRNWLHTRLEESGVTLENIFIGQVGSNGELFLDLFDDTIQTPRPRVRETLYAALEKTQAELQKYALETGDPGAKEMYSKNGEKLGEVMEKLKPYLLR